ncbi:MAG TPA: hypothetical protein PKD78_15180, partial [Saprospiraceae bacterium]|nr:hypothetical protein [Saprospiraceae bacterium]
QNLPFSVSPEVLKRFLRAKDKMPTPQQGLSLLRCRHFGTGGVPFFPSRPAALASFSDFGENFSHCDPAFPVSFPQMQCGMGVLW